MSGIYLTWVADALRAAGLKVIEYDGWQYRAKSSGGYTASSRPWCVMWHHTASQSSPESDARYMAEGADAAPIANVSVVRDGTVWVLAAGPTNTNGSGGPVFTSKGEIPVSAMNSYAFGMEICNSGVGEPYPTPQINAAFVVSNTINAHLGNRPDDAFSHFEWAPDRKVDPATAYAVGGNWQPIAVTTAGTWSGGDLRSECTRRASTMPTPTPPPQPSGDDIMLYVEVTDAWARFVATGQADPLVLWQVGYTQGDRAKVHADNLPHVQVTKAQLIGCSLFGSTPPPADDGGSGMANWDPHTDFYEWVH